MGRVLLVLALALGLGGVAGWALGAMGGPQAVPVSTRPLPAGNPDQPTSPLTDDPRPSLSTDLAYVPDRLISAGTRWTFDVPAGWERVKVQRGIRWVLPGGPEGTYSVRVAPQTGSSTVGQLAAGRLADLYDAERQDSISDVELVALTDDTLEVTYSQNGRLRYQHSQFVPASPSAPTGVFEVTTSGRLGDRDGLDALAEHMVASVTRS